MLTFIKSGWQLYDDECNIKLSHLWVPKYIMIPHLEERICEILKQQLVLILRAEKGRFNPLGLYLQ